MQFELSFDLLQLPLKFKRYCYSIELKDQNDFIHILNDDVICKKLLLNSNSQRPIYKIKEQFKELMDIDLVAHYKSIDITPICYYHKTYPIDLKNIYDPPFMLYTKGKVEYLHESIAKLAIVGTRSVTEMSEQIVKRIVDESLMKNFIIVSGLAKGIDSITHGHVDQLNGKTIAVIAGGHQYHYPKCTMSIRKELESNHLVVSEYPPMVAPKKWMYPMRNRIISGLSRGVVIIQAKEKSGSLITLDCALDQNRDAFCVPGSILDETFSGNNLKIQEGAYPILSASDILSYYHLV